LLLLLSFYGLYVVRSQTCQTTRDSVDASKKCIFPFKFKGVTYNGCPVDLVDKDRRWCSTKVDRSGNHVTGEDKYGFCSNNCPIHRDRPASTPSFAKSNFKRKDKEDPYKSCVTKGGPAGSGVKCQIPFVFKGIQYWGCPVDLVDASETWCSTKVDDKGNHITGIDAYVFCSSSCPKHKQEKAPDNAPESCSRPGEECRPTIQCSAQFSTEQELRQRICKQSDGSRGTCCRDITEITGDGVLPDFGLRAQDVRYFKPKH